MNNALTSLEEIFNNMVEHNLYVLYCRGEIIYYEIARDETTFMFYCTDEAAEALAKIEKISWCKAHERVKLYFEDMLEQGIFEIKEIK